MWQRRFGGETAIVGRDIQLDGEKYSVIGVMPGNFQFLESYIGLWVPAALSQQELANYDSNSLTVVARLRKGITLPQADAEIKTITQRIVQPPAELRVSGLQSFREMPISGEIRRPLFSAGRPGFVC